MKTKQMSRIPSAIKDVKRWELKNGVYTLKKKSKNPDDDKIVRYGNITRVKNGKDIEVDTFKEDEKIWIEGIANANIQDRWDERVEPAGIIIDNFKKNPVLLSDHAYASPYAIGLVEDLSAEMDGVHFLGWVGDPQKAPLTDMQKMVRSLIAQRILKTVSIGFIPLEIKAPVYDNEGKLLECAVILRWELLEISVVPVPCNQGSLFEMKSEGSLTGSRGTNNNINKSSKISEIQSLNVLKDIVGVKLEDVFKAVEKQDAEVQSLLFDKNVYSTQEAKDWVKSHDFKSDDVDIIEEYIRLRQRDPDGYQDDSFRAIDLDDGIKAVIGKKQKDQNEEKVMEEKLEKMLEAMKGLIETTKSNNDILKTLADVIKSQSQKECDDDEDKDKDKDEGKGLEGRVKKLEESVKTVSEDVQKMVEIVKGMAENPGE